MFAEEAAEFDQQRLRRQGEDRKMANLARLDPLADLRHKLTVEVFPLKVPVLRLMILMRAAANFDIERAATIGRIAVGKHRRADLFVGDRQVMPADVGGIPQNVGRAVVVDRRDDFNASLVASLHRQQALFRVLIDCIDVDQFVVDVAEQHQVADVVGEQRRTNSVAARSRRGVGDDVRHEAEILVLGTGDQVPDQGFVASRILAPTAAFAQRIMRVSGESAFVRLFFGLAAGVAAFFGIRRRPL